MSIGTNFLINCVRKDGDTSEGCSQGIKPKNRPSGGSKWIIFQKEEVLTLHMTKVQSQKNMILFLPKLQRLHGKYFTLNTFLLIKYFYTKSLDATNNFVY